MLRTPVRCPSARLLLTAVALAVIAALAAVAPAAHAAVDDVVFRQCANEGGTGPCGNLRPLDGASDVAVSPDGLHAYASAADSSLVQILDRNPLTGVLRDRNGKLNCYRDAPVGDDCTDVRAMSSPRDVLVSPDGLSVYVAARGSNGVAVFDRNTATGRLTQKDGHPGCLTVGGSGGECASGRGLGSVLNLFMAPDGRHIYATAENGGGGIAILQVAPDGALSQVSSPAACVTGTGSDGSGNACGEARGMGLNFMLAISPDGENVYSAGAGSGAVSVFDRNQDTGNLTQLAGTAGCVSTAGGSCATAAALTSPQGVVITPNGQHVYALGGGDNGSIVHFSRDGGDGTLDFQDCVREDGSGGCAPANVTSHLAAAAISPDGRVLVAKTGASGVGWGGFSSFTVGSDGQLTQLPGRKGCSTSDGFDARPGQPRTDEACGTHQWLGESGNVEFVKDAQLVLANSGTDATAVYDRQLAPSCAAATVTVPFQTTTSVPLTCTDPNNDPVVLKVTGPPAAGSLGNVDQTALTVPYTPRSGFSGADSFTFSATDASPIRGASDSATGRGVESAPSTITLNVLTPPPPSGGNVDTDGDGVLPPADCDNANRNVFPGATDIPGNGIDEDCSNGDATRSTPRLETGIEFSWKPFKRYTRLRQLTIEDAPRSTVTIRCSGRGCPFKTRTVRVGEARDEVKLARRFNRTRKVKLRVGTTVEVRVTAPGTVGRYYRFKMRRSDDPRFTQGCLAADSGRRIRCS